MKKKVLITAIGTITATSIVKELRKSDNYHLIGTDINNRNEIVTSLDVDEFIKFPNSTTEEYVPFAVDFCKEHGIEYYFAVIDKEVVNISKNREVFEGNGTKLCVVNYEFANMCHYKDRLSEWLRKNEPSIAIEEYRDVESVKKAHFPLFIKPIEGVSSVGCMRIDSYKELITALNRESEKSKMLIQDYIEGRNITVDCIRNRKTGQSAQIQRREILRNRNGCGIAVEIIHDFELEQICNRLMTKLDLNGVCNMEFFDTGNGYKIIEINPRFSAGTAFSCMAGINTVQNALYIADEKDCEIGEIDIGAHFAERYEPYRLD